MTNSTHIPKGSLSSYIKFIWYSDGYQPESIKERILPAGSSQLIINLEETRFRHFKGVDTEDVFEFDRAVITGIQTSPIFLDARTRTSTMGVVFWPGGIQALFGLPAGDFTDQVVSAGDVMNITVLRQKLLAAATPNKKICLLESFLTSMLDLDFKPNPAVILSARQVYNQNGKQSVSEITKQVGYSRRRLSELFRDTVGTSPKQYSRIQRFQQTLRLIRENSNPDLSRIAQDCGYYDQAHYNRDFKALSGITPTEYLDKKTGELNHLPV